MKLYGNRIRKNVYAEVSKMMNCGSLENGYIESKCIACGRIQGIYHRKLCCFRFFKKLSAY
ncbi:hypothetical protein HBE96_04100 [Clostridium sp. P21]|uniref:Transposase zinc-binding domain-containing protein n=1 Tax=Clostridium muellerianum TaxID=2716538 RepID=A0A7Y0EED1_9CLOT|nr:hypothetical protein [Clostridium muellerianum]